MIFLYSGSYLTGPHNRDILSDFTYSCVGDENRLYDCRHSSCGWGYSVDSIILTCMGQTPGKFLFYICLSDSYSYMEYYTNLFLVCILAHTLQSILNIPNYSIKEEIKLGSL